MNRQTLFTSSTFALLLLGPIACSSSSDGPGTGGTDDAGVTQADASNDDASTSVDASGPVDAGPPDTGAGCPALGEELEPGVSPPKRGDMVGAYDETCGRVLMFFGDQAEPVMCGPAASNFVDDAWAYDPARGRWAAIPLDASNRPQRRARGAGAWDKNRGRALIFGGRFRAGTSGAYTYLADLWAYDPTSNAFEQLSDGTGGPSGRMNVVVVADPAHDRLLVHGGGTLDRTGAAFLPFADTWAFDLAQNTWSKLETTNDPPARLFHGGALDPTRNRLFVFAGGGANAFTTFDRELWYLDLDTNAWTHVPTDASFPAARIKMGMLTDAARDRLILFAGHDDQALGNDNELWTLDLATITWTRVLEGDVFANPASGFCNFPATFATIDPASPERRESHLFVGAGDVAFMFGGRTDCGLTRDHWSLDLPSLTWTELAGSMSGLTCFRSGRTDCDTQGAMLCQ